MSIYVMAHNERLIIYTYSDHMVLRFRISYALSQRYDQISGFSFREICISAIRFIVPALPYTRFSILTCCIFDELHI